MSKKSILLLTLFTAVLFLLSLGTGAVSTLFINNSEYDVLTLNGLYAIGSGGLSVLSGSTHSILSADGAEEKTADFEGGSGLVEIGGTVRVSSNIIKVGIDYYFNSYRDSSVETASFTNKSGGGFAFGYYDENRVFVEKARTSANRISVLVPDGKTVCITEQNAAGTLYSLNDTGIKNMVAICAISKNLNDTGTTYGGYTYSGGFELYATDKSKLTVINVVELEPYIMGVCATELTENWPIETLKAQAVAARTYVGRMVKNTTYYYTCGFDVTDDTYCQAYLGNNGVGSRIQKAVTETSGEYLTYEGKLIDALYMSSDGGATEDNANVNGGTGSPYLAAVEDPYEEDVAYLNPYSSWHREIEASKIATSCKLKDIIEISSTKSEAGNTIEVKLTASDGESYSVTGANCYRTFGVPSIRYDVTLQGGILYFDGSGAGHNLGMSQFGAYSMAVNYEKTYRDILGFYYTGVSLSYGVYDNEKK